MGYVFWALVSYCLEFPLILKIDSKLERLWFCYFFYQRKTNLKRVKTNSIR
jgi:hypothetical protein